MKSIKELAEVERQKLIDEQRRLIDLANETFTKVTKCRFDLEDLMQDHSSVLQKLEQAKELLDLEDDEKLLESLGKHPDPDRLPF